MITINRINDKNNSSKIYTKKLQNLYTKNKKTYKNKEIRKQTNEKK